MPASAASAAGAPIEAAAAATQEHSGTSTSCLRCMLTSCSGAASCRGCCWGSSGCRADDEDEEAAGFKSQGAAVDGQTQQQGARQHTSLAPAPRPSYHPPYIKHWLFMQTEHQSRPAPRAMAAACRGRIRRRRDGARQASHRPPPPQGHASVPGRPPLRLSSPIQRSATPWDAPWALPPPPLRATTGAGYLPPRGGTTHLGSTPARRCWASGACSPAIACSMHRGTDAVRCCSATDT